MGKYRNHGFTLIELSIVLVIIGLIVGGVMVGQSLVRNAEVRAQITQIEKYNTAVNTFRGKFAAVPGDMPVGLATQFGFTVGTTCTGLLAGFRNGDGLIDGDNTSAPLIQGGGETALFWQDLSSPIAGELIDVTLPNGSISSFNCSGNGSPVLTETGMSQAFPVAKIGHENYLYVYDYNGANWYGLSTITSTHASGPITSNAIIPVIEAYNIDSKIDDGFPTTGNVQAAYIANTGNTTSPSPAPNTTTSGGNSTSCYDTTTGSYSIGYNNGNGANCALSFRFQ